MTVPGEPIPLARPRVVQFDWHGRLLSRARAYTPAASAQYEKRIHYAALAAWGNEVFPKGPLRLEVQFTFQRTSPRARVPRADLSNLVKVCEDGLRHFFNDLWVVELRASKVLGPEPFMKVQLTLLV